MINNNSIELAAKQVQAEEEPFVLALPVMFGEKSSCAGICDRLTTQYNKEKKQYLRTILWAKSPEISQDTLRYMVASDEDETMEEIMLPASINVDWLAGSFFHAEKLLARQYTPQVVEEWALTHQLSTDAGQGKAWITLRPVAENIHEEHRKGDEKINPYKFTGRDKVRRLFFFILFAAIGYFAMKAEGCAKIQSILGG